ncbi:hypothetical protein C8R45DRAFT_222879 [Mycena sanguinolenta]|nr:hypothetical protein C8R45DRAFT_222879 [Mycena sanguinolenta]
MASISSALPPIFEIGLPPRQDRRSSIRQNHSESSSRQPSPSTARNLEPEKNWEDHVVTIKDEKGAKLYRCVHPAKKDPTTPCNYTAKKQLVKRHVETTHLEIKLFVCDICRRKFSQKIGRDVHRSTHTGEKPHKCQYPPCDKIFSDPARRFKHHADVHGRKPLHPRKKKHTFSGETLNSEASPNWTSSSSLFSSARDF